jgi:hypothetical protein
MYFWARSVVLRCPRDKPSQRAAFSSIHAVRQQRVDVAQQVGCFQFGIYQSFKVSGRETRRGQYFLQMRCPVKNRHQVLFCNHCVLSIFHSCVGKERGSGNRTGSPPEPRNSRRTAPLHAPEVRSKLERSEAKLLTAKRKVKNAQELRRGIDHDRRLFVRMPRGHGTLKEMEPNGATQNRRSGSRAGVNNCWGRSSLKGSVGRIYLRQHHQQQDDEYPKPQQEQPGSGNSPPRHSGMFRQTPGEVNPPKDSPQKDPNGCNPPPGGQTELGPPPGSPPSRFRR